MVKLYVTCGFIGSGKTTFAKELAKQKKAFRFSMDEWMIPLYGEHMERDVFDARLNTLQGLFKQSALQLAELDVPVILDFGLWKQEDRMAIARWAEQNQLELSILYLDVDFEECKKRALARNEQTNGDAYQMTPEMLELFWSWFEPPKPDEPHVTFISER
ncbi:AAA family ATPase [Vibrio mexicanus]|uniref:AAA family ATPase n=1 Tax=Vibrio mexicanus TaxID=1004326 RepID=UPI00063C6FA9|nr:ATP-binding protein [Vibrio mexicanus]